MGAHPSDQAIAAHIESVSARADSDTDRLVSTMLGRCWPGGPGDRTETVARQWLSRWRPRVAGAVPPVCSCPAGRCGVCN
jgi:hypothetical protein